ncbi:MAG TPA: AAA family ATPase [Candidatus Limnocylindrales bacterium]|nr:AAA family ATPase [Candidatus Limnocylindrales bacterium]
MRPLPGRLLATTRRRRVAALAGLAALILIVGIGASRMTSQPIPAPSGLPTFTYAGAWDLLELQRHIEAGEVVAITTADSSGDGTLAAKTVSGQVIEVRLDVTPAQAADALATLGHRDLLTAEAWQSVRSAAAASSGSDPVRAVLGPAIPLVMIALLVLLLLRAMGRGGRSRDKAASFTTILPAAAGEQGAHAAPAVRLADVAGCDEAKTELTETIEFLRDPARFASLGARIPHGIMLYGPPGTGKTMLAKAVAAEAGVPFLYASGSEFVEKYVGVGARRVRDLFAQARKLGRAVVFFDEFDALGKARGGQNSHEEREQTLNQLLVELDGFGTTEDIVVIAATNRLDVLDPAVLRPGRFNRKIHVGLPDVRGRAEILAVHARGKPLAEDVDLGAVARRTYGFSGAQLADLLNEAAILAARRELREITAEEVHAGWLKVAVGTSRRRSMDERERSIIAAHEVGHAICGRLRGDKRRVEEISLFAHGEALGVTVSSQEDNDLPSESDLRARLVALMGGRAAEELLFQEVTAGASNDFEKANQIATAMVMKFGMGRDPEATDGGTSGRGALSFLVARPNGNLPSEVQPAATRAIRAILDEAYAEACELLVEHMETLRRLAAYLVEHERVDGDTFDALFERRIEVPTADREWRPSTARPREWGEIIPFRDRRFAAITRTPVAGTAAAESGDGRAVAGEGPAAVASTSSAVASTSSNASSPVTEALGVGAGLESVVATTIDPTLPPVPERVVTPADAHWLLRPSSTTRTPIQAFAGRRRPARVALERRLRRGAAAVLHAVEVRVRPRQETQP